jgi:hypothetical protein
MRHLNDKIRYYWAKMIIIDDSQYLHDLMWIMIWQINSHKHSVVTEGHIFIDLCKIATSAPIERFPVFSSHVSPRIWRFIHRKGMGSVHWWDTKFVQWSQKQSLFQRIPRATGRSVNLCVNRDRSALTERSSGDDRNKISGFIRPRVIGFTFWMTNFP